MLTCEERFKRFEQVYGPMLHSTDKTFETAKDTMTRKPYAYANITKKEKVSLKKKG